MGGKSGKVKPKTRKAVKKAAKKRRRVVQIPRDKPWNGDPSPT